MIHHLLPNMHGKAVLGFLVPTNLLDLHHSVWTEVENGTAELETERDLPILNSVEKFGSGDIEIKRTGNKEIH